MSISQRRLGDWCFGAALTVLTAVAAMPAGATERGPARLQVQAATTATPAQVEARVIVKFKADSNLMQALSVTGAGSVSQAIRPQHAQALSVRLGMPLRDGLVLGQRSQLIRSTGITSVELAARLSAQSDVEYAVVDVHMRALGAPNDPYYGAGQTTITPTVGQWYLRSPSGTGTASSINAEAAWNVTAGKSSVVVAVLDTGITHHPDLDSKVLPGYDFVSDVGRANDGDGRDSDPSDPGDGVTSADVGVVANCTSADIGASSWHGTQTSGLIGAATNNGIGMASIGHDVMLLPLRVLGKCGGTESDVESAMLWAAGISVDGVPDNRNPAKVINMSLGGPSGSSCSAAYQDVVNQVLAKGVVVVAAAGNQGLAVGSPANCVGVIGVAGVRHTGTKVGYSDLGNNVVISAPAGNCVNTSGACLYPLLTTSNNGTAGPAIPIYTDDTSHPSLGTSFSAPLVSGTVALMFSANPALTPAAVRNALMATARAFPVSGAPPIQRTTGGPFFPVSACTAPTTVAQGYECYCTTSTCGAGLLDAGAAVAAVVIVTANISVASTVATAGTSIVLDGSSSHASGLRTIVSYQWAVTSGAGLVSFTSATNAATAILLTKAAGGVTVTLTVTDSVGQTDVVGSSITINAVGAPTPTPTPTPVPVPVANSSGGGSMAPVWLFGWLAAVIGVYLVRPRRR